LYVIASGKGINPIVGGFAANGFAEHSPGKYDILSCFVAEVLMTFFFLIVILGATHGRAPKGFAPIAIGLCLTLIHLITIPVTNTSVNPARSTGPAVLVAINGQNWAVTQLWVFWVAPVLGALLAGFIYYWLVGDDEVPPPEPVVGEPSGGDETTANVVVIEETIIEAVPDKTDE
jgi:aquaporin Z